MTSVIRTLTLFTLVVLAGCQHNTPVGRTKRCDATRNGLAIECRKCHAAVSLYDSDAA